MPLGLPEGSNLRAGKYFLYNFQNFKHSFPVRKFSIFFKDEKLKILKFPKFCNLQVQSQRKNYIQTTAEIRVKWLVLSQVTNTILVVHPCADKTFDTIRFEHFGRLYDFRKRNCDHFKIETVFDTSRRSTLDSVSGNHFSSSRVRINLTISLVCGPSLGSTSFAGRTPIRLFENRIRINTVGFHYTTAEIPADLNRHFATSCFR